MAFSSTDRFGVGFDFVFGLGLVEKTIPPHRDASALGCDGCTFVCGLVRKAFYTQPS